MQTMLDAYIECALWSTNDESTPEGGEPLDRNYSASDLALETLAEMTSDCEQFWQANADHIGDADQSQVGHDLWLTRNGHGTGFWDRDADLYADQDALTEAAHAMGERNLYVGDDGLIYQD